jgi:hypothetical protein
VLDNNDGGVWQSKATYLMSQETKKRKEEEVSHPPSMAQTSITPNLLKILPPPSSNILGTKTLTHGPLVNIQHPEEDYQTG